MAPGSMTHHSDMHARYFELDSAPPEEETPAAMRTFALPVASGTGSYDSRRLPRGYYMLFALNTTDIPSEAAWVRIK